MKKTYNKKRLDEGIVRKLFGSQLSEDITEAVYDAFIDMHKSKYRRRHDERRIGYIVSKFSAIIRAKQTEAENAKNIKSFLKKIKFINSRAIDNAFLYMLNKYDEIIRAKEENMLYGDSETYSSRTAAFRRPSEERGEPIPESFQYFYKKFNSNINKTILKEAVGPIPLDAKDLEKIFNSYLDAANTRYFANKSVITPEAFTTVMSGGAESTGAAPASTGATTPAARAEIPEPPPGGRPEHAEPRGVATRAGSAAAAPPTPAAPVATAPTTPAPAAATPTEPAPTAAPAAAAPTARNNQKAANFNELIPQLKNVMGDGKKAQIVAQAFKQYFEDLKNKTVVKESSNRKFKIILKEGLGTGAATTIVNTFLNTDKPDYEQFRKPEIAAVLINFISKYYMKDLRDIAEKNNLGSVPTFKNQQLDRATSQKSTATTISPGSEISVSGIKYKVDIDSGTAKLNKIGE